MSETTIAEQERQNFIKGLENLYQKSQEEFEKKVTLLTASSFGASVFLIDKLIPDLQNAKCKVMLFISWGLLGGSLLLNLYSHLFAGKKIYRMIKAMRLPSYDTEEIERSNRKIQFLNWITFLLIALGLCFLVFFSIINLI